MLTVHIPWLFFPMAMSFEVCACTLHFRCTIRPRPVDAYPGHICIFKRSMTACSLSIYLGFFFLCLCHLRSWVTHLAMFVCDVLVLLIFGVLSDLDACPGRICILKRSMTGCSLSVYLGYSFLTSMSFEVHLAYVCVWCACSFFFFQGTNTLSRKKENCLEITT